MKKFVIVIAVASALAMFALTAIAAFVSYQAVVAPKAAIVNGDGKVIASDVTSTELGYLSGVTSALQTQLDAKGATAGVVANLNGRLTNATAIGISTTTLTNTDLIAGGPVWASATSTLVGKTIPQAYLLLGIQGGSVVAAANGTVTNTFTPAYSGPPTVVVGSFGTNQAAHLISVTLTNCVLGTLTAGSNITFIAIGTP